MRRVEGYCCCTYPQANTLTQKNCIAFAVAIVLSLGAFGIAYGLGVSEEWLIGVPCATFGVTFVACHLILCGKPGSVKEGASDKVYTSKAPAHTIAKKVAVSANKAFHGVYIGNDTQGIDVIIRAAVPDMTRAPYDNSGVAAEGEHKVQKHWSDTRSEHEYYFSAGDKLVRPFYEWMTATQARYMCDRVEKALSKGKTVLFLRQSDERCMGEIVLFHYVMQKMGHDRDRVIEEYQSVTQNTFSEKALRFDGFTGKGELWELCPATKADLLKTEL